MRRSPPWLIVVVWACAAPASAAPAPSAAELSPLSIRFRDLSQVDGEKIRLGDIARIIAGQERAVAELETLVVAQSAAFGLSRLIDTEALYARYLAPLSSRFLIDYDHKTVKVATRAAILPQDSLARMVDAFLDAQPKRPRESWRWELVRSPGQIKIPVNPHHLGLAYVGLKRKGKIDLNLAIRSDSRVLRNLPITINLRVEEPVLVAKSEIARDAALDGRNVALEMRETTQFNDQVMAAPEKLMGLLARQSIAPGRVITPRLVVIPPAVKRGQEAKVVYMQGDVRITADVVCRQDGIPGQVIMAQSLANRRLMRVRVVDVGRLEPVPGG